MASETSGPKLHLVHSRRRMEVSAEDFYAPGSQELLFPLPRNGLLIFVHFPDVTEEEFRATLEHAKPAFVLELRSSPRFDIGRLNRQLAFQVFRSQNTTYLDLTSSLMGKADGEAVLARLKEFLQTAKPTFERPVVFLLNRSESSAGLVSGVLDAVTTFRSVASQVYEVPKFGIA